MQQRGAQKKNLLLCLDAFGTLFTPRQPIAQQYAAVARKHGLRGFKDEDVDAAFRKAFKEESRIHPNYGKAVRMKAPHWWSNIISKTFHQVMQSDQQLPSELIPELLLRFNSHEGYRIYKDVLPFFAMLRDRKAHLSATPGFAPPPSSIDPSLAADWPFEHTIVGIITNSDDRIPDVLSSFGLKVGARRVGGRHGSIARADPAEDISFVALSYDVGFEKPYHQIFDATIWLLEECLAAEAQAGRMLMSDDFERVYVGDDVAKDVAGAQDAGWTAVLLDREGKISSLEDEPVVTNEVSVGGVTREVTAINDLRNLRLVFE